MTRAVISLAAVRRARARGRRVWTAEDVREHGLVLATWGVVGLIVLLTMMAGPGSAGLVPGL